MLHLIICFTTFKKWTQYLRACAFEKMYAISLCTSQLQSRQGFPEDGLAVVGTRLSQWERTLIPERTGEVSIGGSIWIKNFPRRPAQAKGLDINRWTAVVS